MVKRVGDGAAWGADVVVAAGVEIAGGVEIAAEDPPVAAGIEIDTTMDDEVEWGAPEGESEHEADDDDADVDDADGEKEPPENGKGKKKGKQGNDDDDDDDDDNDGKKKEKNANKNKKKKKETTGKCKGQRDGKHYTVESCLDLASGDKVDEADGEETPAPKKKRDRASGSKKPANKKTQKKQKMTGRGNSLSDGAPTEDSEDTLALAGAESQLPPDSGIHDDSGDNDSLLNLRAEACGPPLAKGKAGAKATAKAKAAAKKAAVKTEPKPKKSKKSDKSKSAIDDAEEGVKDGEEIVKNEVIAGVKPESKVKAEAISDAGIALH